MKWSWFWALFAVTMLTAYTFEIGDDPHGALVLGCAAIVMSELNGMEDR